jgi:predicted transcriptional regulator
VPREWKPVGWASFQVRVPVALKQRLVHVAHATGQSQQSIIIRALEEWFANHATEAEASTSEGAASAEADGPGAPSPDILNPPTSRG